MLELERAYVEKFCDGQYKGKQRNYGFAAVLDDYNNPTGEQIFFHMGDAQWMTVVDRTVTWNRRLHRNGKPRPFYAPSTGTEIVFKRTSSSGELAKAAPWSLARDYDARVFDAGATEVRIINPHTSHLLWHGLYNSSQTVIQPLRRIKGTVPSRLPEGFEVQMRDAFWSPNGTLVGNDDWHYWPAGFRFLTQPVEELAMR